MNKRLIYFLLIADVITTMIALGYGLEEHNPFLKDFVNTGDIITVLIALLILKTIEMIVLIVGFAWIRKNTSDAIYRIYNRGMILILGIVPIWNLIQVVVS